MKAETPRKKERKQERKKKKKEGKEDKKQQKRKKERNLQLLAHQAVVIVHMQVGRCL